MIRSHDRGWPTVYKNRKWVYEDTGEPISENRPCKKCGKRPSREGYDACLGYIQGVVSACCGHGVNKGIMI